MNEEPPKTERKILSDLLETEKKYNRKFLSDMRRFLDSANRRLNVAIKENNETCSAVYDTVSRHEKYLTEVVKIVTLVEETLCNVLLAIKQNEYLKAWYPAQLGHEQTKVVGIHPAKIQHNPIMKGANLD